MQNPIVTFETGDIIEIDAGVWPDGTIRRRLAMVSDTDHRHFMILTNDQTEKTYPLLPSLNPEKIGNPSGWAFVLLQDYGEETYRQYSRLQELFLELLEIDSMTYYRALYWAKQNLNFDPALALQYGQEETKAAWHDRLGFIP